MHSVKRFGVEFLDKKLVWYITRSFVTLLTLAPGNGLVDVLYGAYNPRYVQWNPRDLLLIFSRSGRLPFTIGKSVSDYSAQLITTGSGIVPIPYNEGIFIDYRHFDQVSAIRGHLEMSYD